MSAPEAKIAKRTVTLLQELAAQNVFTPQAGERCRRVLPSAIRQIRVLEGSENIRTAVGFANLPLPAMLVCAMPVETASPMGVSLADDEVVRIAIQVVENTPQDASTGIATYAYWMSEIRKRLLAVPNPFLQDTTASEYDPYVVYVVKRLSADAAAKLRHNQSVGLLVFQVMVRHPRGV